MRTIEETIDQFYRCISFKKGEQPFPEKLNELFIEDGIMINYNGDQPERLNIPSFVAAYKENVAKGIFPSLIGKEISHKTEVFGKIAQRFSTYEFHVDTHVSRGIETIQLIQINGKWVITSVVWHDQNEMLKIPEKYLD
jgi:hypothetical protein